MLAITHWLLNINDHLETIVGLLDELRREAAEKLSNSRTDTQGKLERLAVVESAMQQIFSYLNDLCKQLNILMPVSNSQLELLPKVVLSNLKIHGFAIDRRAKKILDRECLSQIVIGFLMENDQNFQLTRDVATEINRLNDLLRDSSIRFTKTDKRGDRNLVTHAVFDIMAQLRGNITIDADYDHGEIRFRLRNVDRIGSVEFLFDTDSISESKLEEFTKFLFGKPNQFRANQLPPR